MKMKLTKIKLINWHLFTKSTIEVNGNFLLTGENGSGKSTFTDALYYLLSGGDEKCFNHAANANARRTLASYVKGKLGNEGEGKEFLRNSTDIVGHIAIELQEENHSAVFGCVIEIVDDGKPKTKFYIIQNHTILDEDFLDGKRIVTFNELKNRMKAKGCAFSDTGLNTSFRERQKTIGRDILKLTDSERYAGLLKDAIAFRPIDEVSTFVTRFLLKEDNVDIINLMEEIRSYRELKKQLNREEEKIKLLETFVSQAEKYHDNCEKLKYFEVLKELIFIQELQSEIETKRKALRKTEDAISELQGKIDKNQESISFRENEKRDIENDELFKVLKEKQDRLNNLKEQLTKIKEEIEKYQNLIADENKIIRHFSLRYRFMEGIQNDNFPLLKEHLRTYQKEIEGINHETRTALARKENEITDLKGKLSSKQSELSEIKKGKNRYDEKTTKLISIIKDELLKKYKKEIEVRPLCEYLEINDERWTNALEGYLNTQRFALIIDPVYFDDALKIYEACKTREHIHGVSIFNCKHNPNEISFEENSLFTKLSIQNRFAEFAASMLLGHVICVDDVIELKNYRSAITDTCMKYNKRMADNINPEVYRYPFIGKNSILRRQEILTKEINELEKNIKELGSEKEKVSRDLDILSKSEIKQLLSCKNVWAERKEYEEVIAELEVEIREDQDNKGFFEIQERLSAVKKALKMLYTEKKDLLEQNNTNLEKSGRLKEDIDTKIKAKESHELEYQDKKQNCDQNKFENFLFSYQVNIQIDKSRVENDCAKAQNYNNSVRSTIIHGMNSYVKDYAPSMSPLIENVLDFIQKYYELRDRSLVDFRDRAFRAYEKSQEHFKNDFIAKLSERIKEAKDTLRGINQYLKKTPFGTDREIYQFEYDPSDVDEMKEYYKIITSGKVMEVQSLLDESLSDREKDVLKQLFDNIIIEHSDTASEQKIEKYLDYRNYMKFDIKMTNMRNEVSYFSKTNKEKSGGETQTPFYVIIAACFNQLLKRGNNSVSPTCLVILDEAFNNMDESRIQSLMEFYKQLDIQLCIVVPSNRMPTLSSYMDTVIGFVKSNNRVNIIQLTDGVSA